MKQMNYDGSGNSELLYYEDSDGYGLAVVNTRGSHPCGYITFPSINMVQTYDDVFLGGDKEYFCVHGGFTFLGTLDHLGLTGEWLGWDYAHLGDWTQSMPPSKDIFKHRNEHKYTTEEIVEEARKALEYIRNGKYEIEN